MKLWAQFRILFFIVVVLFSLIALARWIPDRNEGLPAISSGKDGDYLVVDWMVLRALDVKDGSVSDQLKAIDGRKIKIPGFLVPLEDNLNKVSEFLLVPSPQACIHVPPPPPNQIIFVRMKTPVEFQWNNRAFWIFGTLKISENQSPYGKVSFEMDGDTFKYFSILE